MEKNRRCIGSIIDQTIQKTNTPKTKASLENNPTATTSNTHRTKQGSATMMIKTVAQSY